MDSVPSNYEAGVTLSPCLYRINHFGIDLTISISMNSINCYYYLHAALDTPTLKQYLSNPGYAIKLQNTLYPTYTSFKTMCALEVIVENTATRTVYQRMWMICQHTVSRTYLLQVAYCYPSCDCKYYYKITAKCNKCILNEF